MAGVFNSLRLTSRFFVCVFLFLFSFVLLFLFSFSVLSFLSFSLSIPFFLSSFSHFFFILALLLFFFYFSYLPSPLPSSQFPPYYHNHLYYSSLLPFSNTTHNNPPENTPTQSIHSVLACVREYVRACVLAREYGIYIRNRQISTDIYRHRATEPGTATLISCLQRRTETVPFTQEQSYSRMTQNNTEKFIIIFTFTSRRLIVDQSDGKQTKTQP